MKKKGDGATELNSLFEQFLDEKEIVALHEFLSRNRNNIIIDWTKVARAVAGEMNNSVDINAFIEEFPEVDEEKLMNLLWVKSTTGSELYRCLPRFISLVRMRRAEKYVLPVSRIVGENYPADYHEILLEELQKEFPQLLTDDFMAELASGVAL